MKALTHRIRTRRDQYPSATPKDRPGSKDNTTRDPEDTLPEVPGWSSSARVPSALNSISLYKPLPKIIPERLLSPIGDSGLLMSPKYSGIHTTHETEPSLRLRDNNTGFNVASRSSSRSESEFTVRVQSCKPKDTTLATVISDQHRKAVAFVLPTIREGLEKDRILPESIISINNETAPDPPTKPKSVVSQATHGKHDCRSTVTATPAPAPNPKAEVAYAKATTTKTVLHHRMSNSILAAASWGEDAEGNLLSNLAPRERMRQEVLWKIVTSEERYVGELLKVKDLFIEPLLHPYSSGTMPPPPTDYEDDDFSSWELVDYDASTCPLGRESSLIGRLRERILNDSTGGSPLKATSMQGTRALGENHTTSNVPPEGVVAPHQLPEHLRICLELMEGRLLDGHVKLSENLIKSYEGQYPLVRSLADVFLSNWNAFGNYATYVLHLERALRQVDNALSTFSAAKEPKNQNSADWLNVCKYLQQLEQTATEKGEDGLAISLSKPFQHLLNYPLLFQNLLVYTDPSTFEYESTLQMIAELETTVRSIEDEKIQTQQEDRDKTIDVLARIEGLDKVKQLAVPKPSRLLVEERQVPNSTQTKGIPKTTVTSFQRLSHILHSTGVGDKRDLWLLVFNDVVLLCQRTGTSSLPMITATNSQKTSSPEPQDNGKAKYTPTEERNTHIKPRNMYKLLNVETWLIGGVVRRNVGDVWVEDVVQSMWAHRGIQPRIVTLTDGDSDDSKSTDFDNISRMAVMNWRPSDDTTQKPITNKAVGGMLGGPSSYARKSSANVKFGTRLVSGKSLPSNHPASRRTQGTPSPHPRPVPVAPVTGPTWTSSPRSYFPVTKRRAAKEVVGGKVGVEREAEVKTKVVRRAAAKNEEQNKLARMQEGQTLQQKADVKKRSQEEQRLQMVSMRLQTKEAGRLKNGEIGRTCKVKEETKKTVAELERIRHEEHVNRAIVCFDKLQQFGLDGPHQTDPIEWTRRNREQVMNLTHLLSIHESSLGKIYPRFTLYVYARTVFSSNFSEEAKRARLSDLLQLSESWMVWDDIYVLANHQSVRNHLLTSLKTINDMGGIRYHDADTSLAHVLNIDAIAIDALLLTTLRDHNKYKQLVRRRGQEAQALLNLLQARLGFPLDPSLKRFHLGALIKLSRSSGLYPECMILKGIEIVGKVAIDFGGYGDIWKGLLGGKEIAVKVLKILHKSEKDKFLKEFSSEAVIWRQLKNPNVLPFYGVFHLEDDRLCLASPWMNNGNIVRFLQTAPETKCVPLLLDIAKGLNYLHTLRPSIIHGDIKGVNILITESRRACLADFGLAAAKETQSMAVTSAAITRAMGTLRWQAPELLDPDADDASCTSTSASDVYAYACVCYEIFSGQLPFNDIRNDFRVMSAVRRGQRPLRPLDDRCRVRGLNDEIWNLIETCWAQEAKDRPSTCQIMERILASITSADDRPQDEFDPSFPSRTLYSQAEHPFSTFATSGIKWCPRPGADRLGDK